MEEDATAAVDASEPSEDDDQFDRMADKMLTFLSELNSSSDDPLPHYLKEIGPKKILSRDEETSLGMAIGEDMKEVLGAIARSPAALTEILVAGERIECGELPLGVMVDGEGMAGDDDRASPGGFSAADGDGAAEEDTDADDRCPAPGASPDFLAD